MGRFKKYVPGKKKPQWYRTCGWKAGPTSFYIKIREPLTIAKYKELAKHVQEELNKIPTEQAEQNIRYSTWIRSNAGHGGIAFRLWRGQEIPEEYDYRQPAIQFGHADRHSGTISTYIPPEASEETVLWDNPDLVVLVDATREDRWNRTEIEAVKRAFQRTFEITGRPTYRCGWAIHYQEPILPKY